MIKIANSKDIMNDIISEMSKKYKGKFINNMKNFISELNISKDKIKLLEKWKNDNFLKRVIRMTYDTKNFNYDVNTKNIKVYNYNNYLQMQEGLDQLEFYLYRYSPKEKPIFIYHILSNLSKSDADIMKKVINRDLNIGVGAKTLKKIFEF